MSMNKVIHSAIRRDLDRFVKALLSLDPGDVARAGQLGRAWDNFDDELTHHHTGEHEIAWPALEQVGVTREMLDADGRRARRPWPRPSGRRAPRWRPCAPRPGADEIAAALTALQTLREVTVQHLDHEEAEIEPIYLANVESPAIKEMGRQVRAGPEAAPGRPVLRLGHRRREPAGTGRRRGGDPETGAGGAERCVRAALP